MNKVRTIHTVDAPAGSGKTYQAIHWALTEAVVGQSKIVLVFRSIELLKQALRDAQEVQNRRNQQVQIQAFHSKSIAALATNYSVSASITAHLAAAKHGIGEILMITDAAYFNIAHWPNRWMWTCILDEIPAVAPAHKLNTPDNHQMLTDYLQLGPDKEGYSQVFATAAGKTTLLRYAENSNRDEISAVMAKLAHHIVSPYFETYVKTQKYERVRSGNGELGARQINMFSLLLPNVFGSGNPRKYREQSGLSGQATDAFADVILMGAGFQDSLLGLIWPHLDLDFKPHQEISKGLRYQKHSCGSRLQIQYLFETDWSKAFRGKQSVYNDAQQPNLSLLVDVIVSVFGGEEFIFLVNKDIEKDVVERFEPIGGKHLPNAPWGLNKFQHIHNAGILSALNPTPAHVKFLNHMGLDGDAVREAMYHSQVYQAIMRTSLRDLNATQPVRIVLPDRKCAEAIGQMFSGSMVLKSLENLDETKSVPAGCPKLETTKPASKSRRESRQRSRAIDKEIKRIQAGGAVDDELVARFHKECRADNKRQIQLQQVVEQQTKLKPVGALLDK